MYFDSPRKSVILDDISVNLIHFFMYIHYWQLLKISTDDLLFNYGQLSKVHKIKIWKLSSYLILMFSQWKEMATILNTDPTKLKKNRYLLCSLNWL